MAESRLIMDSWFAVRMFVMMLRVMMYLFKMQRIVMGLMVHIKMSFMFEFQWLPMDRLNYYGFFNNRLLIFVMLHSFPIRGIAIEHRLYIVVLTISVWIEDKI